MSAFRSVLCFALGAAVLLASPSRAQAQVVTLDSSSTSLGGATVASVPIGDLVPIYGAVHVAWSHGTQLRHAWKLPDPWQTETVADSARGIALAVHGDGLAVVSFSDYHGRLICGERSPSGWALDTVATYPGSSLMTSVALDPEPVIAYVEAPASGPATLRYARRSGGSWTIVDLDHGSFLRAPSVAIGPAGKCGVVAGVTSGTWANLVWYEAAAPGGPFTSAVLDTEQFLPASLVWDVERDRPMIAYGVVAAPDAQPGYRFTWRNDYGSWERQELGPIPEWSRLAISLALDIAGAPGAFWQDWQYLLDQPAGESPEVNSCGSIGTGFLRLSNQRAAAPSSSFTSTSWYPSFNFEWTSSNRAVASHWRGVYDMVWREPIVCTPHVIFYREGATGVTAVPFTGVPDAARITLSPNPLVAGGALRLRWSLPRAGDVRIDAHDLAGRRVASLAAGRAAAGQTERTWEPPRLRAGIYWVSLVVDGERLARSVLVRR